MPDRIIRDELLESERWLALRDNGRRLAYVALLLKADGLGNLEGHPQRLLRLWISFGINTAPKVEAALQELAAADLVRLYEVGGKRFVHIPRFGQNLRYLSRLHPESPWTTDKQKQQLGKNSQGDSTVSTPRSHSAHGRSEEKRREEKRSEGKGGGGNGVDKSAQAAGSERQPLLKHPPGPETSPETIAREKRVAERLVAGDVEGAKAIKEGRA